ncbi:MAG: family transporter [Thermoleophilia bacterium]|nr:family transporter [Thermoleophilia bacterium]
MMGGTTPHREPIVAVVAGSVLIAWSGILVRLADLPPATAAFLRCAYAVPLLVALAWWWRRSGRADAMSTSQLRWAIFAGVSFGADLVLWHVAIGAVGAGLATVLGNTQVFLFPFAAWLVWREQPTRRQAAVLPALVFGIVLISGAIGADTYGDDPLLGVITGLLTAVAYAGFLIGMRAGSPTRGGTPVNTLAVATFVAAIVSVLSGLVLGDFDPTPTWPAHGWMLLLAWGCQVLAWMLVSGSLARVRAARVSILLLVQPLTALILGVVVLSEDPSLAQWIGAGALLLGVVVGGAGGRDEQPAPPTDAVSVSEPGTAPSR